VNNLVTRRIERRMTQTDVAKRAGIATSTYSLYESGTRTIPKEKAALIAEALDCRIEDIFLPVKFAVSKLSDNDFAEPNFGQEEAL